MSDVSFKITADAQEAIARIAEFAEKSSKSLSTLTTFAGFAIFAKAAGMAMDGIQKLGEAISSTIAPAAEADDAFMKMATTMKLAGNYSDEAIARFESLAAQISNTSRYSGVQVQSSVAVAQAFGISNEATEKLIRASADLAAVTGVDLKTATEQLGKTYIGTAGQLGNMIPGLKGLTEAELQSGAAIDFVAKRFSGAAEAMTGTFSGALEQSKNKFDDMLTTIGQFITQNPVVIALIKEMGKAFDALGEFLNRNKKAITEYVTNALVGLVNFIPTVISGLQTLGNILGGVVKFLALVAAGALDVVLAFTKFLEIDKFIADIVRGLGVLASGLLSLIDSFAQLPGVSDVFKAVGVDVDKLHKSLESMNESVVEFTTNVNDDDFSRGIQKLEEKAIESIGTVDGLLDGMNRKFEFVKNGAEKLADSITKIGQRQGNALKAANEELKNQAKIMMELTEKQTKMLVEAGAKNPFAGLIPSLRGSNGINLPIDPATGRPIEGSGTAVAIGAGASMVNSVLGGARGATDLLAGGVGAAANAFMPGLGPMASEIFKKLAEGPDAVKAMIKEFFQAIPDIVVAVAEALPEAIPAIFEGMGEAIDRIVEKLPDIMWKLVQKIPDIIGKMITTALTHGVTGFIARIVKGAVDFIGKIIEGAGGFIGKIIEGAGQFIEKIIEGAGKVAEKLNPFGDGRGGWGIGIGGGDSRIGIGQSGIDLGPIRLGWKGTSGGMALAPAPQQSQPIAITLKVGHAELAQVMYDLNRRGYRTS
jgi:hypothetical protein